MLATSMLAFQAEMDKAFTAPWYFGPVMLTLLAAGALGWLIAAVLGFTRARVFGSSARWFALASVCLLFHHLMFVVLALGIISNSDSVLSTGAFFNLFVALGAVCAIVGFTRLTNPRP